MPQIAKREPYSELAASAVTPERSAVRTAREARGYSIEELSLACGLAAYEIADIESGKDADPSKRRRIASALQFPESALFDEAVLPAKRRSVS
ncbi:helix-turn-helix domain-containing protein [Mesorhizobium sp. M0751]|uniref:helix-turn-helix domain-containing protein n=1 Tax=unclassified Mesorhizobium TaxID=325217 RepID=UPI0033383A44